MGKTDTSPFGIKATVEPVKSINGSQWVAKANYLGIFYSETAPKKEDAIHYLVEKLREVRAFNALVPETVEI